MRSITRRQARLQQFIPIRFERTWANTATIGDREIPFVAHFSCWLFRGKRYRIRKEAIR